MYSKPLAAKMDGLREAPGKVKRGAPLGGAVNFSSFLPQNSVQAPALAGKGVAQGLPFSPGKNAGQGPSPLEQAATQSNFGLNQLRALTALNAAKSAPGETHAAEDPQTQGLPLNQRDLFKLLQRGYPDVESAETAVRVKAHRKAGFLKDRKERFAEAVDATLNKALADMRQKNVSPAKALPEAKAKGKPEAGTEAEIGKLSARFESGNEGVSAIGYDRHGGTSYGKYQMSSRAGTVRSFIAYLKTGDPDIAERLEKAGPANTGGKNGSMPAVWKKIAEEDPARFEELQDKFIRASHFEPAMRAIAEKTGVEPANMPFALQEVVFSTAVQHGPNGATRIIARALGQVGEKTLDPGKNPPESLAKSHEHLIRKIYDNRSGQFGSSAQSVQAAVNSRLKQEMSLAISMLRQGQA
ncbi:MAG: chitosanase [Deltaproteobacteria bacterium]|jgi:hypothetical protein|nr:chitosanase [Deltaproteobacteria bacterium]